MGICHQHRNFFSMVMIMNKNLESGTVLISVYCDKAIVSENGLRGCYSTWFI